MNAPLPETIVRVQHGYAPPGAVMARFRRLVFDWRLARAMRRLEAVREELRRLMEIAARG